MACPQQQYTLQGYPMEQGCHQQKGLALDGTNKNNSHNPNDTKVNGLKQEKFSDKKKKMPVILTDNSTAPLASSLAHSAEGSLENTQPEASAEG